MGNKKYITLVISIIVSLLTGCTKTGNLDKVYLTSIEDVFITEDVFINADIEEQLVFDNHGITIKAVSLNMNADEGPTLVFSGTKTVDTEHIVKLKYCSVNNIMIEPKFEMRLNSIDEITAEAVFPKKLLLTADIKTFSSISFIIHIADASNNNFINSNQINIITTMSGEYAQKHEFPGAPIIESNGVTIMIGKKADSEASLSKQIYIYIDNTLSEDIVVETKETSINGIEMDPMFFETVCAGKKSWACLSFRDSEIVENGIVNIDELIISFRVFNIFGPIIDSDCSRVKFSV